MDAISRPVPAAQLAPQSRRLLRTRSDERLVELVR
ncbi:MAG: hypothetical protein JWN32_2104, partial [Solirubrobacterales bacterium]|nr:hypothetical protein [Solirubrobacterales bacterium]